MPASAHELFYRKHTLAVELKQAHIDRGKRRSAYGCPYVLALQEAIETKNVLISFSNDLHPVTGLPIGYYGRQASGTRHMDEVYILPEIVQAMLDGYDWCEGQLHPHTFEITFYVRHLGASLAYF